MIKIGFTGTSKGMNQMQFTKLKEYLESVNDVECHHGDCIGSDEVFDKLCHSMNFNVVIHPPIDSKKRAYCVGEVLQEKEYLSRNKDIVDEANVLLATPKGKEVSRSGTWSTIRYAKKIGKKVIIF